MLQVRTADSSRKSRPLRVGDVVEIKSLAEIMESLDDAGRLDGMPFMPEMAAYCGRRAMVSARAHKTCDGHGNLRWLDDTVHLDGLRCTGTDHGGCQARCRIFWKTAWLRRVTDLDADTGSHVMTVADGVQLGWLRRSVHRSAPDRFVCQATEVINASRPLPATNLKQYVWDVSSGNHSVRAVLSVLTKALVNRYQRWSRTHLPLRLRIQGGRNLGHVEGAGTATPRRTLDLDIGERARVRPLPEIEPTLNSHNMNRGLMFDSEMARWCGATGTVADRVQRIVDDRSGEMIEINSDCVILDGVTCRGGNRRLCSRNAYDYWREIWLERVED